MTTRVLIADDDDMVRIGMRTLLEQLDGYEVVGEAADGREAARLARQLEPDVVVMDVSMPNMNGIEATRRIVAGNPRVRVLAVSLHTDSGHVTRVLDAGARGYLTKQGAAEQLPFALRTIAGGQVYLAPGVTNAVLGHLRGGGEASPLETLTAREREILQAVAEGKASSRIAEEFHLSVKTVESHRRSIMRKLDLDGVADLTKFAIKHGIIELD